MSTINEFVEAFREEQERAPARWGYQGSGPALRCDGYSTGMCPLTWLARRKTRETFPLVSYVEAGKACGLSTDQAKMVASAADNAGDPDGTRLRDQLLEAMGLQSRKAESRRCTAAARNTNGIAEAVQRGVRTEWTNEQ